MMKTPKTTAALRVWQSSILKPRPDLLPSSWAEANVVLDRSTSSDPGPFRFDRRPWQRAMVDSVVKPGVRKTTFLMPSQVAKTTIENLIVGYFIAHEPAPIMLVAPSEKDLTDWVDGKLEKMIDSTKSIRQLIGKIDGKRRPGQRRGAKFYPGGVLYTASASSPKALSGRSVRVVVIDEVARLPERLKKEGDPLALSYKRAADFWNRVIVQASTPLEAKTCRILRQYDEGNGQQWHVRCPCCGHIQTLNWNQVRWEKDHPETARLHCSKCDEGWTDQQRIAAIENAEKEGGGWIAERPWVLDHASFKLNGLYRTTGESGNYLEVFVRDYLKARAGGTQTYRVWVNTFLAEGFSEDDEGEILTAEPLLNRCEDYSLQKVPRGVLKIVVGADTQDDRSELAYVGYGAGEETWHLGYVRTSAPPGSFIWEKELDAAFTKTFEHPSGEILEVSKVFIDAGGHKQEEVYAYCKNPARSHKCIPIYGSKRRNAPTISNPRKQGGTGVSTVEVGQHAIKNLLHGRLQLEKHGAGFIHFPKHPSYDQKWFASLTCERRVTKWESGVQVTRWEGQKGNEPWDCTVYAHAAFKFLKLSNRQLDEEASRVAALVRQREIEGLEVPPVVEKVEEKPEEQKPVLEKITMEDLKRMTVPKVEKPKAQTEETPEQKRQRELAAAFRPKSRWLKDGGERKFGTVSTRRW